jgi:phosphatidylserine decarboxylase
VAGGPPAAPRFAERPTAGIVGDALWLGAFPFAAAVGFALAGLGAPAVASLGLAAFVGFFFRNPERALPAEPALVVAPADGRVVEVGEVESADGSKTLRIGIFLSVFDVHVNRAPVAGRVVAVEREGGAYLAAFDPRAPAENVRVTLTLETEAGARVRVVQIAGWLARRVVCHPRVGEWVARGARYGLIRFGSRTDVWLPGGSRPLVGRGARVRGGSSGIAELPGEER